MIVKFVNRTGDYGNIHNACQVKDINGNLLSLGTSLNDGSENNGLWSSGLFPVNKGMSIYCLGGFQSSNGEENFGSTEIDYTVYFYPYKKSS